MPRFAFALLALLVAASSASAQVFYEPVQYQYVSRDGVTYYYGGSDPLIHRYAGIALNSHREISSQPQEVYLDKVGHINARLLGYTISDARNEAYDNVPRYFAKRDLLNSAVRKDGAWVVPATAPTVRVYKSNGMEMPHEPATMPRPLMIIPKDLLEKQLVPAQPSDKKIMAMNQ